MKTINSLYIKNYKLFKELRIDNLAQVNLIIGKNNVGKTSLLEAMMLLSDNQNIVHNLFNILCLRKLSPNANSSTQQYLEILRTFFHNQTNTCNETIFIGANEQQGYSISLSHNNTISRQSTLVIKQADNTVEEILLSDFQQIFNGITNHETHQAFVSTRNEEPEDFLSQIWGKVALSEKEQYLIDGLKIIDDNIEKLVFIDDTAHTKKAIVKLRDTKQPVLLNTMGDGINLMLRTLLTLVHCENGYLFIDEFATGLHWSVQATLWKMIFQLSLKLNIQIFVTTHSLDTLYAFQEIAKHDDTNVAVIKLQKFPKKNKIKAIHFKTEDIMIAVEQNIEVR
ncbi:AAA family ATPase [Candidatus Parabeggiatoa sp. HSG14]|uniref:AAA family ATPase n=1 Tax=Candidatus Parabeggiatoa sp. HSG14 TaxID=3055593 RepID=UPI0025A73B21|nr:AAA family ATPase [Thiotrichales bacterium HSG14]